MWGFPTFAVAQGNSKCSEAPIHTALARTGQDKLDFAWIRQSANQLVKLSVEKGVGGLSLKALVLSSPNSDYYF